MKRLAGQAGRFFGTILHTLGMLLLTAVTLLLLLLLLLAFRLSLGPIQLPYLASRLATAVSGQGIDIHVGQAALAWGGYRKGGAVPLYLQLGKIIASNAAGVELANVPDARLVFLPSALIGSRAPILVNSADAHFAGATSSVSLLAAIRLNFGFHLSSADLFITLGAGSVAGEPIQDGVISAHLTPHDLRLDNSSLTLTPHGTSAPLVGLSGAGRLDNIWSGNLTITVSEVRAADLGIYWPPGLNGAARGWITRNITAGRAHDARLTLQLSAPRDLSDVEVTGAAGGFAAAGLTMNWIPGAVPITALDGTLTVKSPDVLEIAAPSAKLGNLRLSDGTMTISGLTQTDQTGAVAVSVAGTVQDAIAVLNGRRLALLATAPPELAAATGRMTARVTAKLPLKTQLPIADVALDVQARISDAAVPGPVDGLGLTSAALDLHATGTNMTIGGTAVFAGAPAAIAARAVFALRPSMRSFSLKTVLGAPFFQQYGLDSSTALTGPVKGDVPSTLSITANAAGGENAVLDADLTDAALGIPALGWSKPAGKPGTLQLAGDIANDGSVTLTQLDAAAPALAVHGIMTDGGTMRFDRARVGETVASGSVTPAKAAAPWMVDLRGPSLSVRAILSAPKTAAEKREAAVTPGAAPARGPAWRAKLVFDTFRLAKAPAPILHGFRFSGDGEGGFVLDAQAAALTVTDYPVTLAIGPAAAPKRRAMRLTAADAGELLRVLAAYDDLQGGAVDLNVEYGNRAPVTGTLLLNNFRLMQAPLIGKILQGLTIYGVAEAASGPGLSFNRAVVPFSIAAGKLTLNDARAYSEALGFTATGSIALVDGACALNATVIPAYALNALPGKIPVVGKLFTAEEGGGLFSVRVKVTGTLDDPKLGFNPFSALTPGVLRDVFGVSGGGQK